MQPQQSSRIDLVELKALIVKKVGVERFKKYFYYLNRFLSHKLNKSDFDKSCFRLLGRENLPLHNQLICSILKNACQAKTAPPPVKDVGPTKSAVQLSKSSLAREDGFEQSGSFLPNQNQNVPNWSNGALPMSPRKVRSGMRERKPRDRPSPLGPTGRVDPGSHQLIGVEECGSKVMTDNGEMPSCDYQRPMQHLQAAAEPSENERERSAHRLSGKLRTHSKDQTAFVEDGEEVEQAKHLNFSSSPLLAPLGIPFCSASFGGARKTQPVATGSNFFGCYDCGGLSDSEMLRKRMEQIAALQGIGGVSMECANTLNTMLDVYLKRLIKSCVELVGARSLHDPKPHIHKQPVQGKVINGTWPTNHSHMQTNIAAAELMHEQRPRYSISLLDFKVAMELNPQQLGEDWPLLLEKVCMHAFEE